MSWSISHAVLHEFFLLYMKKYRMLLKTSIVARYLRLAVALSNDFQRLPSQVEFAEDTAEITCE